MFVNDDSYWTWMLKNAPNLDANDHWVSNGYRFNLLQPYVKNVGVEFCPDRSLVDAGQKKHQAYNPSQTCHEPGYGYDDGFVSDSGWGLTRQLLNSGGGTRRQGRDLSQIVAPADMVASGGSYATGSMSALMDNSFSGPDGHAKDVNVDMGIFNMTRPVLRRPRRLAVDAVKRRYDPNAVSDDGSFQTDFSGYNVFNVNETCSQAVAD